MTTLQQKYFLLNVTEYQPELMELEFGDDSGLGARSGWFIKKSYLIFLC